jgi:hypothetical protein
MEYMPTKANGERKMITLTEAAHISTIAHKTLQA